MYTTATVFFQTLASAGITHAFVNWGNDHPALLEDLERQRVESPEGKSLLEIVTCPNEMVALSAAQGYAQVTGKPALVIVHVDVGTQVSTMLCFFFFSPLLSVSLYIARAGVSSEDGTCAYMDLFGYVICVGPGGSCA